MLPCSARIQAAERSVAESVRVFNTIDEWHNFRRAGGVVVPLEERNNAFNNRVSRKSPRMFYQPGHPDVRHAWTCIASALAYGLSGAHCGRNSYGSAFHGHVVAKGVDSRFGNELGQATNNRCLGTRRSFDVTPHGHTHCVDRPLSNNLVPRRKSSPE